MTRWKQVVLAAVVVAGTLGTAVQLTDRHQPPPSVVAEAAPAVRAAAQHRYDWFAHCGMVYVEFGGRTWKVDRPVTVPPMHPDAHGITSGPPIVPGYLTPLPNGGLRFDAPTYITGVTLHVTREKAPLCA